MAIILKEFPGDFSKLLGRISGPGSGDILGFGCEMSPVPVARTTLAIGKRQLGSNKTMLPAQADYAAIAAPKQLVLLSQKHVYNERMF